MSLEEKMNQAKGVVKEGAGKLTSDKKIEVEGVVEKTVASAKDSLKDVKGSIDGAVEGIKNSFGK